MITHFFPKNLASTHHCYTIKESIDLDNHQFIFSAFPDLPFAEATFDVIIAPWFYDILEEDLQFSIKKTLKYMKKEASLIQIGPINVHHADIDKQYCLEEMVELYTHHFTHVDYDTKKVHYLNNPIESNSRYENILFLTAEHKQEKEDDKQKPIDCTIKLSPALTSYKEMIATKSKFLSLIDKDMSAAELALKIAKQFQLEPLQAEFYAESFIKKLKQEI